MRYAREREGEGQFGPVEKSTLRATLRGRLARRKPVYSGRAVYGIGHDASRSLEPALLLSLSLSLLRYNRVCTIASAMHTATAAAAGRVDDEGEENA